MTQLDQDLQGALPSEPPILPTPIYLQSLRKLELIMNDFSYPSVLPLSVRLTEPERALEHEQHLRSLYFQVLYNVTFFLNNLTSPNLTSVQIYIYPKAGVDPPPYLNWKFKPFQRFLQNHKKSLKELYLPDFEGPSNTDG